MCHDVVVRVHTGFIQEADVLEFYDFIRVPLNVLEFVLNVLEIYESCYCYYKKIVEK